MYGNSKYYKVKGTLYCQCGLCQCCKFHYVGSAITFKERLRKHKSNINTGKKRCGAAKYFLKCCTRNGKFDNPKIQIMESVNVPENLLEKQYGSVRNIGKPIYLH